jgi:hypothetical protein
MINNIPQLPVRGKERGDRMTKILYKLTDQNMQTHRGCQWVLGEKKTTSGEGDLCGPGWLHCYADPLLAVLLNPIHADYKNPRLFRARVGRKSKHDHGLKSGYTKMTLIEEIPVPAISTAQRVRFAILCAMKVYQDPGFVQWGETWLSGKDRSAEAAEAAAEAAWAAGAAAWAAAWAAEAAEAAAWAAAWEAEAAGAAAWVARAPEAAWEAEAAGAARAAWVAAWAAEAEIDLISIAHEAVELP